MRLLIAFSLGHHRDHTSAFAGIRRRNTDKAHLELSRLEKRLTKLTQLLADPPPQEQATTGANFLWSVTGATKAQQRRQLEQSIIDWEDDASVSKCPFCQQEFSSYSFRRHHCRLCGRVVCNDPRTGCSTEVGLNVATENRDAVEKALGQVSVDVRMCQNCKHTLFSKSDFARELANRPPVQRAYDNLVQFERGIRLLMPRFQKLLVTLQDPERPPTPAQLQDATKVRKRLMDAFAKFNTAAQRIRDLPTESQTDQRLQKAVYQQAYNFLSLHMLPLKTLPKILKHASPHGRGRPDSASSSRPNGAGALAAIKYNSRAEGSVVSSGSDISSMEAEERQLRERLIVLEEQRFLVREMVADATRHRRFDEVTALAQNAEDLSTEVDQIQGQLAQLDFAAAYGAQEVATPPAT